MESIRPIAIYLPQFHPIPENDLWWGKGFTDWANVSKAKPLLKNHYQPHIPADFGYYDLRDVDILEKQSRLSKDHGIAGFCFYHYWFNGKRLLNLPVDELLRTGKPDFPFCLAWANEDWTRAWDGSTGEILIKQQYNDKDDLDHIRFLCSVFSDKRYIRVDGKPLFIIYQPALFPDIRKTLDIWRQEALKNGTGELYLCYFENILQGMDPVSYGFDAAIEFQPNWWKLPPPMKRSRIGSYLMEKGFYLNAYHKHMVFDYFEVAQRMIEYAKDIKYKRYRCLMPMWDNSPRRKKEAAIFIDSTPEKFAYWLNSILQSFKPFGKGENFLFINAWNEWGEGNHLEPSEKWGHAYLKVTKQHLISHSGPS